MANSTNPNKSIDFSQGIRGKHTRNRPIADDQEFTMAQRAIVKLRKMRHNIAPGHDAEDARKTLDLEIATLEEKIAAYLEKTNKAGMAK